MQFKTRKPTGRASWPFILLTGVEGAGKTWAAVETTAMEQIDRAFFIELGEGMADEYGAVPGADFEVIEHDGTVGQIREAIAWAAEQPAAEGKHNLLIFDSLSELWSLLSDNAQAEANRRAKRKGRRIPDDGAQITMDLWNRATDVWEGVIAQLQRFPGPAIGTARLEMVTVMDDKGQPTSNREWKIQAQKRLPYRAQVIVQARAPRRWTMTKIATTVPELQLEPGAEMTFDDFSVPKLLTAMGVTADTANTTFVEARQDDSLADEQGPADNAQRPAQGAQRPAQAPAQGQAQQPAAQAEPGPWLAEQARKLLETEGTGDIHKVRAVHTWAEQHGRPKLAHMAEQTIERMEKAAARKGAQPAEEPAQPTLEEAQSNAQEVLEAEIVEEG